MTSYAIKNNIKSIRELNNYTQYYMAEELGITQAGYCKLEKGKTDLSFAKLEKIAQILECTVETILNFDHKGYVNSFKQVKNNESIHNQNSNVMKLYEDKIQLLELLLNKTDLELKLYKTKYGRL
jgi:transcriptional regulator with XRE-family HTH domain